MQSHSAAKLRLIEHYLDAYFDAVLRNPTIDRLRITLIDGFCGGGAFDDKGAEVDGTPFLLLKAVERAQERLNIGKAKPLTIDAQFHFIDMAKGATSFLKDKLIRRGYLAKLNSSIFIHTMTFEESVPKLADAISKRTARGVGRSLFLLDQKGYAAAPLGPIRTVFSQFAKAECILTFAVDWLIDYLNESTEFIAGLAPIEISPDQLREFLRHKDQPGGRYIIQRLLLRHLRERTGAQYATPFFIKSREASKDLWLVHLSRHATARNVMVDSHWSVKNHSIHHGYGGLELNGFDPHIENIPDFMFADHEKEMMNERLAADLIRRLHSTSREAPIVYTRLVDSIANETPARLSDIDKAMEFLVSEKEMSLLNASGKEKRIARPGKFDLIYTNPQITFSFSKVPSLGLRP